MELCWWKGKDGGTTGVVEGEEEGEGERLAHREGRRWLAGQTGLVKFFWVEEEETEDPCFSWGETNELLFRIFTPLYQQSISHDHILLSHVPAVVFLTLGETTGIFQTGTQTDSAGLCGKKAHIHFQWSGENPD